MRRTIVLNESQFRRIIKESMRESTEVIQGFDDVETNDSPSVTMIGYKLVRLYPNPYKLKELGYSKEDIEKIKRERTNKIYPPYFINKGWELGKWYTAGLQDIIIDIDDESGTITKMRAKGKNPRGATMDLSPNVGLHALELPLAYDNASKTNGLHMPQDLVWAEVEINFEPYDKKSYMDKMGTIKSKEMYPTLKQMSQDKKPFYKGGFIKGINGKMPKQEKTKVVTVYLSSDFKFNRLLTQDQVIDICNQHGVKAIDHDLMLDLNYYFPNDSWKGKN